MSDLQDRTHPIKETISLKSRSKALFVLIMSIIILWSYKTNNYLTGFYLLSTMMTALLAWEIATPLAYEMTRFFMFCKRSIIRASKKLVSFFKEVGKFIKFMLTPRRKHRRI